ncbi:efflux RND transporter periplasmic adaptor subunit [Robiginitalea biformata]|nr:efflux RND transporter periplasmic adaptor subunit [Robiginitalea biformata]
MFTPGILYRIGMLLLAVGLGACNSRENPAGNLADREPAGDIVLISPEQFDGNGMQLGHPQMRNFAEILEVSGTIDVPPENRAVVSAVRGGFVKSISLLVGDRVRKGQRIAALENPEFLQLQQDYLETREQLPYKKAEYRRQKTLYGEKISSEKSYLQAESDYKTALARLGGLGSQLKLLNFDPETLEPGNLRAESQVYAPIAGSVTQVNVIKGAFVSQATEIVEIVDDDHIHLELTVYEKDIGKLRIGQPIRFSLPEQSGQQYNAEVYLIGTSIGPDRTVKVHAHLAEATGANLLVGMFVRAQIELGDPGTGENSGSTSVTGARDNASPSAMLSLPEGAVVTQGGQSYILVLEEQREDGYRMRQIPISTGQKARGFVAVTGDGLSRETTVLVRGAFSLIAAP